jgi:hypothetical protein
MRVARAADAAGRIEGQRARIAGRSRRSTRDACSPRAAHWPSPHRPRRLAHGRHRRIARRRSFRALLLNGSLRPGSHRRRAPTRAGAILLSAARSRVPAKRRKEMEHAARRLGPLNEVVQTSVTATKLDEYAPFYDGKTPRRRVRRDIAFLCGRLLKRERRRTRSSSVRQRNGLLAAARSRRLTVTGIDRSLPCWARRGRAIERTLAGARLRSSVGHPELPFDPSSCPA